jgi:hypothetical protein
LQFSLSYFTPCSYASFCASFSFFADIQRLVHSPPQDKACDIRFCVDPGRLPPPTVVDLYPSEGPSSGGTHTVLTVRNFPIVAIGAVKVTVGVGVQQVNAELVSFTDTPGSTFLESTTTLIFSTCKVLDG